MSVDALTDEPVVLEDGAVDDLSSALFVEADTVSEFSFVCDVDMLFVYLVIVNSVVAFFGVV